MPVRIVLDTNVMVSALLSANGPPGIILSLVREQRVTLLMSSPMLSELRDVLHRAKLRKYLPEGTADDFISAISAVAEWVRDPLPAVNACQDPQDNMVLATAWGGAAQWVVTGDLRHLVSMGSFRNIVILTPAQALERLMP